MIYHHTLPLVECVLFINLYRDGVLSLSKHVILNANWKHIKIKVEIFGTNYVAHYLYIKQQVYHVGSQAYHKKICTNYIKTCVFSINSSHI